MTDKENITNNETRKHIVNVIRFINFFVKMLLDRAVHHDTTKLMSPEVELFALLTDRLASCTYGSEEYKKFLKDLDPALKHHYACNRHHPEHFVNGVTDMTLVDLVEMFCDWKAATLRHNDGNLLKSIEHNASRFDVPPVLTQIFKNTATLLEEAIQREEAGH